MVNLFEDASFSIKGKNINNVNNDIVNIDEENFIKHDSVSVFIENNKVKPAYLNKYVFVYHKNLEQNFYCKMMNVGFKARLIYQAHYEHIQMQIIL